MRIGIGLSTFAQEDHTPMELFQRAGVTVVPSPTGKRLTAAGTIGYPTSEKLAGFRVGLKPLSRRVLATARPTLARSKLKWSCPVVVPASPSPRPSPAGRG
jgi:hypothetical protein